MAWYAGAHGIAVGQPEPNTADVGLVHQPGCDGLERGREPHRVRGGHGVRGGGYGRAADDGDPGVGEHAERHVGWHPALGGRVGECLGDPGLDCSVVYRDRCHGADRPLSPLAEPGGTGQGLGRRLRVGERRHARAPGDREHRGWVVEAEQARRHRDVRRRGRRPHDGGLDLGGVGHVGRDVDGDEPVDLARGEEQADRLLEDVSTSGGDQIHRVLDASRRRQRAKGSLELGGELGDLEPGCSTRIGGNDAGAAAVAHHRDPSTGRDRLVGEQHGRVEQLGEGVDADDTGLAEERVDRGVGVGQRRGVEREPRAPAVLRPLFSATMGLRRANSRATRANVRGLPNDSR